jgi:hypothetical protein
VAKTRLFVPDPHTPELDLKSNAWSSAGGSLGIVVGDLISETV